MRWTTPLSEGVTGDRSLDPVCALQRDRSMSLEATSDLWWKNAIIYCVDTQSFLDTDGDGVGDLDGLTQRVDYLAGLGVTCLWLMPIYPSPERDYGYDVADYYGIAAKYGSLGDLVELVRVASERGIRVIADLVINHTSVDHPWFQMARKKHPIYHDFYVWADEKPPDADEGVIFPGKQDSIWSYDRSAKRWYMHRFMPFQPDLNINNPLVRDEIHKVIGFWLALGLSGFRIDAVPFLIEQEGLEHEEVADPHDYLRDIRDFASRRRGDVMLLAEANEPIDLLPNYFGEHGEQMHVAFNFVVNQAMYLALTRGEATPVAEALRSMPPIPPESQWAQFVRNHDELSLDKLSDEEREEVFAAFAPKASQRLFDRGIRRRLPTMVDGDRRRMELMYSLCFTLPGAPVLFYGEEIGLGDNPAMAEREAVRLPMQWTAEPGAGFTTADEKDLPRKLLRDGPFGYRELNVEAQQRDRDSFLNWMERAIRTRKEWPEFGWGEARVLGTHNPAVLATLAVWDGRSVLAVHNFSGDRAKFTVQLPEDAATGRWHQIFAPTEGEETALEDRRLSVELGPYEYRWLGSREGV
jgi:maltose alpha-D-glucosyltransferase / alpha-amylase